MDLSDLTIPLSRNDKIYPKTEKKNPCKPDLENVLLDRGRHSTVRAGSLLLTGLII